MAVTTQAIIGAGIAAAQAFSPTDIPDDLVAEVNATTSDQNLVRAHTEAASGADIVILGAALNPDCAPPNVLDSRVDRAAQFARFHPTSRVIVTGGQTRGGCLTEAQTMEAMLRAHLAPNPIVRDDNAASTVGNAANVSAMTNRAVLVTSQDHLPRASANFRDAGVTVTGVAAL